jgi:hypothetical protein
MPETRSSNESSLATHPRRRVKHVILAGLALVLLLAIALAVVVSRPAFVIALIEPELERRLGGHVQVAEASWAGLGRVDLRNVTLRVHDDHLLPERAGEIVAIGRMVVDIDVRPLLTGRLSVRSLLFEDVVLRVAEDSRKAGLFSLHGLNPSVVEDDRRAAQPPRVEVRNLVIEAAVYDHHSYTVLGRRHVSGTLAPTRGRQGEFDFDLREIADDGETFEDGLHIVGQWAAPERDESDTGATPPPLAAWSFSCRIDGLTLDDRTYAMCPQYVRLWWEHMDLRGRVTAASLEWTARDEFVAELAIEQVALTLPQQIDPYIVRYRDGRIIEEHTGDASSDEERPRPRMELHSGAIRWTPSAIELVDVKGRFIPVREPGAAVDDSERDDDLIDLPYVVSLRIEGLPPLEPATRNEWLAYAMEVAPFHLQLETSMDATERLGAAGISPSRAIELPLPVARAFEHLQLADWSIRTSVEISRGRPTKDDDGVETAAPIERSGELVIHHGSMRLPQFTYPVHDVRALVEIEQDVIVLREAHARGAGDSRFTVSGTIDAALGDPEAIGFDFQLEGVDVPLDETFHQALPERNQGFFQSLLSRAMYESFDHAGMVGPDAHPDDLEEQLRRLGGAHHETDASGQLPWTSEDTSERDRLIARIERGPITLGGLIHINLRVQRNPGPDNRTNLHGTIETDHVGVVFDRFPLPFTVMRGKLDWSPRRISIVEDDEFDGLSVVLPGGGRGRITGSVLRPRIDGRRRMLPDLHFSIVNEPMTDLLAASIPLTQHDQAHLPEVNLWPGGVFAAPARLLRSIGLDGSLRADGRIVSQALLAIEHDDESDDGDDDADDLAFDAEDTHVTYDFDIRLADGTAAPGPELAEQIGAAGLFWPDDFVLRNVEGRLIVSNEHIHLQNLHGWHEYGGVSSYGSIDRTAKPTEIALNVTLSDLELHETMINIMPSGGLDAARALWEQYQPQGRFSAELRFRETGGFRHPVELTVLPHFGNVTIGNETLNLTARGGRVRVTGGEHATVYVEDLSLNLRHRATDHGDLFLDGEYGLMDESTPRRIEGDWRNAAVESPIVTEAMRLIRADRLRGWFEGLQPQGRVNLSFAYESPDNLFGEVARDPDEDGNEHREADGRRQFGGGAGNTAYWLHIEPRHGRFVLNGTPMAMVFDAAASVAVTPGKIRLSNVAGRIGDPAHESLHSSFRVDGTVRTEASVHASLQIDFDGRVASDEIIAFFPSAARQVLQRLEITDGESTRVQRSRLDLYGYRDRADPDAAEDDHRTDDAPLQWEAAYDGTLALHGASMNIGVPAREIHGRVDLHVRARPASPTRLKLAAAFDQMRVLDRLVTDVRADNVHLNGDATAVLVPQVTGTAYGGSLVAEAVVEVAERHRTEMAELERSAEGMWPGYRLKVQFAGLGIRELTADLAEQRRTAGEAVRASARTERRRGEAFGEITLAGYHGRPDLRRGRGILRVTGGQLETVPLALHVFNALQGSLPLRGDFDNANAEFFIDGDRLRFERIVLESTLSREVAASRLVGFGDMNLNTFQLNLRLYNRSGLPGLSELSDLFYSIEVTGTPGRPSISVPFLRGLAAPGEDKP